jgi:hypothetical protein
MGLRLKKLSVLGENGARNRFTQHGDIPGHFLSIYECFYVAIFLVS